MELSNNNPIWIGFPSMTLINVWTSALFKGIVVSTRHSSASNERIWMLLVLHLHHHPHLSYSRTRYTCGCARCVGYLYPPWICSTYVSHTTKRGKEATVSCVVDNPVDGFDCIALLAQIQIVEGWDVQRGCIDARLSVNALSLSQFRHSGHASLCEFMLVLCAQRCVYIQITLETNDGIAKAIVWKCMISFGILQLGKGVAHRCLVYPHHHPALFTYISAWINVFSVPLGRGIGFPSTTSEICHFPTTMRHTKFPAHTIPYERSGICWLFSRRHCVLGKLLQFNRLFDLNLMFKYPFKQDL